jgi:hypothetical protein
MVNITFNGESQEIASIEEFGLALDRFDQHSEFELWVSIPKGPSMCMLRNGPFAWLGYLWIDDDADFSFSSRGDLTKTGDISYRLSNGQVDRYPLSWCVDNDRCYQALAYFFVNGGAKPNWIIWQES